MTAPKFVLLSIVVVALAFASLGIASAGMSMAPGGHMSGCPLSGSALCHMSPLEHAFALQNILTMAARLTNVVFALIAMLLAIVPLLRRNCRSAGLLCGLHFRPPLSSGATVPRHGLQEAFARGIIHSKAF